jgi:hypothetical protein
MTHPGARMTSLYLDITSVAGAVSAWTPGNHHKEAGSLAQIVCSVHPRGRDHLDLETGEIFQNPQYAKLRKQQDEIIFAQFNIHVRKGEGRKDEETENNWNRITYFGGVKSRHDPENDSDPLIHFQYALPQNEFAELRNHILAGQIPKRVSVQCEGPAFSFGWEPDGSGQQWKNLANRHVHISEIRFDFSYSGEESEDEDDKFFSEPIGRKDYADSARVDRAITGRLIAIERLAKWALGLAAICAGLLMKSAIHF